MTDTPKTNQALAEILERDGELSEANAPAVFVKLCKAMEIEAVEISHQLARSQAAGTIWYRRCFGEDEEWQLGELSKLKERLNHAEILLSDLACGYWRSVLNEQDPSGEGIMGERVAQYWARYCEQESTTKS